MALNAVKVFITVFTQLKIMSFNTEHFRLIYHWSITRMFGQVYVGSWSPDLLLTLPTVLSFLTSTSLFFRHVSLSVGGKTGMEWMHTKLCMKTMDTHDISSTKHGSYSSCMNSASFISLSESFFWNVEKQDNPWGRPMWWTIKNLVIWKTLWSWTLCLTIFEVFCLKKNETITIFRFLCDGPLVWVWLACLISIWKESCSINRQSILAASAWKRN